jgi:hypothetical protein
MDKIHTRPDSGGSLQELFHTLFNFLSVAILVRTQRRRGKASQEGFHGLLVFSGEFPPFFGGKLLTKRSKKFFTPSCFFQPGWDRDPAIVCDDPLRLRES